MQAVMGASSKMIVVPGRWAQFGSAASPEAMREGHAWGACAGREAKPYRPQGKEVPMRLCVFCGSSPGFDPAYLAMARTLGRLLAQERIALVYGGSAVGLMGAVADAALESGGEVIGVIPQALMDKEIGHRGLTDLRVVGSMHERKALM